MLVDFPKGVQHKPYAEQEVKLLLVEPRGVLNTGHEGGERTAGNDVWISKRDTSLAREFSGSNTIVRKNLRPNRFHSGGESIGNFRLIISSDAYCRK